MSLPCALNVLDAAGLNAFSEQVKNQQLGFSDQSRRNGQSLLLPLISYPQQVTTAALLHLIKHLAVSVGATGAAAPSTRIRPQALINAVRSEFPENLACMSKQDRRF